MFLTSFVVASKLRTDTFFSSVGVLLRTTQLASASPRRICAGRISCTAFTIHSQLSSTMQRSTPAASNNRFERSRGITFGEPRRRSMIWINQLRSMSAQPRVAQPHRWATA